MSIFNEVTLRSDIEKFFTNEFSDALKDVIGRMYTISDLFEILNSYVIGNELAWISKIDDFLKEIELLDEFSKYVVQMEKLREIIRTYACMFLIYPEGLSLIRAAFAYMLVVLQYGGIERLNAISQREKIERETGNDDFLLKIYYRIYVTVFCLTLKIFVLRIITGKDITPLEWSDNEALQLDDQGRPVLDCGAWRDFNEYLVECGVIECRQNQQPCILM